jgi:hypothetical protein
VAAVIWIEAVAAAVAISFTLRVWLIVRPPPKPVQAFVTPPKPPARDATPDEAIEDMQGHGGRKTALDDREF